VRVAAAPDGRVRYVALDRSSGNDAADAQALGFARLLQFEPTSSTDPLALTWGVVKFYWATK
jgi:TonB family protein